MGTSMRDIRLTIVQMKSLVGNPDHNLKEMERHITEHADSDIICFPEMCLSGYSTSEPERFALESDNPYVSELHRLARETDTAIVFGYIEKFESLLILRQMVIDSNGAAGIYCKTHLGSDEAKFFSAGEKIPVFNIKGVCLGLELCVESHIPDISQTLRSKGAELVLIPFSTGITGDKRKEVWHSYLPARASDNGMFVAACSSVGDNGLGTVFGGGLIALDPKGRVINEYYGTDQHAITVQIGGKLPRDGPETMKNISYFDRRRPELYR